MIIENLAAGGLSLVFALVSYLSHLFALLPVTYQVYEERPTPPSFDLFWHLFKRHTYLGFFFNSRRREVINISLLIASIISVLLVEQDNLILAPSITGVLACLLYELVDYHRRTYPFQPIYTSLATIFYAATGLTLISSKLLQGVPFLKNLAICLAVDQIIRTISFLIIGGIFYNVRLG